MTKSPTVKTPKGIGELDNIYISELGFLMIKIYFENGMFTTYNLGEYDIEDNIFTKEILKNDNQTE
tara:strand:+ start:816 stop:1013 length:198 start_codon:yes stop_codon:yes gene_type:complete